jgi:hypothetical protein
MNAMFVQMKNPKRRNQMKTKTSAMAMGASVWAFVFLSAIVQAAPLGTAFTYQGQLKKDGQRVTNTCEFQFTLWDKEGAVTCPLGGNPIGPTLCCSRSRTGMPNAHRPVVRADRWAVSVFPSDRIE